MSLELEDLKREYSRDRLEQLARAEGLTVRTHRMPCPAGCSNDKRRASIGEQNGVGLWECHGCQEGGTAIDLVVHTRKVDQTEAIRILAELRGKLPEPKPQRETPKKDGLALWNRLATKDWMGEEYLATRGLSGAVDAGFVRFNTGGTGDDWLDRKSKQGYRVALPLYDAGGNLVSFQLRAIGAAEPTKLSLFTISTEGLAFGDTSAARTAPRVFLTEGLADTLALKLAGGVVVGADGEGKLRWSLSFLGHVKGREFVLCPQNDTHQKSQQAFSALEKTLRKAGAVIRILTTPEGHKDPADWLCAVGLEAFKASVGEAVTVAVLPTRKQPQPAPAPAPVLPTDGNAAAQAEVVPLIPELRSLSSSYASACEILRNPALRKVVLGEGLLEYDEQKLSPCIGRRPLRDEDLARVRELAERHFKDDRYRPIKLAKGDIEQAAIQVAKERPFHPVAEYLRSIRWDGQKRIERVASEILHVDVHDSDKGQPLAPVMLRKWMIAAVARALEPGCKVDTVLVFTGFQGFLKSSFFRELASSDWFSDAPVDMYDKDSRLLMRRTWILEWAELDAIQRAKSNNTVKAFITAQVDQIRPPYARGISDFPRTCIIVGSTNQDEFLSDSTGHRRYWVIDIQQRINLALLREWRDQLWAEAVTAYAAGEKWHLDETEERALAKENRSYEQTDAWDSLVLTWANKQVASAFTVAEVLRNALNKDPSQWTRHDENRVADILKRAGWIRKRERLSDGSRPRFWEKPKEATG